MAWPLREAISRCMNLRAFFCTLAQTALCILLATIIGLDQDAAAYSGSPSLISGRTNRDGGTGCAGLCHNATGADSDMTVQIGGPATLVIGAESLYSVTATKASLGANVNMGTAIAASDSPTPLTSASAALGLNVPTGELIHNSGLGALRQTNVLGSANYNFRYRMPASALPGSTHTLYAVARLGFSGAWNQAPNFTVTAVAGAPQPPVIGSATAGNATATVTFTPPSSNGGSTITGYTVFANPPAGTDSNAGTTGLSHVVTGLTNGTAYTFTVVANNALGASNPSADSNSVTPATVPAAPSGVTASAGSGVATVAFTASSQSGGTPITGYTVISNPPGGFDTQAGTTALTHLVTGLMNESTYTFTVTAANSVGNSLPSAPSNIVMPSAKPSAPLNVQALPGNTQITVTFAPPASIGASAITGYTVISNPPGGVDSNAATTSLSHVVTGLVNGTNYTFTVTATNMSGTGPPSAPSNAAALTNLPGAPTSVTAAAANATASVSFNAPASNGGSTISGYTVVSNPPGGVDYHAGFITQTHFISGLANDTSYTFTVTATNANGPGPASLPSASVTPTRGNAPEVLWTRLLERTAGEEAYCSAPATSHNPALDAAGNVFVNGCSLTASAQDVVTHKLDANTGAVLWTATYTNLPQVQPVPELQGLVVDNAGNVIMTSTVRDASFNRSIRTIKYNGATGAEMWNVGYASATSDESNFDIGLDSSGNVVVTGPNSIGMRTIKYNGATGAEMWHAITSGYPYAQVIDSAGNVIVTGYDFSGTRNFRTVKYNGATGAVVWNVSYNSTSPSSYDNAYAIAVDTSGNVVVTGTTGSASQTIKYNGATGAEMWNVASSVANHTTQAVAIDASGNVALAGYSTDVVGGTNFRTVKLNGATGAELWSKSYNGAASKTDYGVALAIDGNGHIIAIGTSEDAVGGNNLRAIKYHGTSGAEIWNHAYLGPSFYDKGYRVAVGPGNSVHVVGVLDYLNTGTIAVVQKIAGISRPGAPVILSAAAGDAQITVTFSAPAIDGGAAITAYIVKCGGTTATGGTSPITVTSLANNTTYDCTVAAANSAGAGIPSAIMSAIPASTLALLAVQSRKTHGGSGVHDLLVFDPVSSSVTVEPRLIGAAHKIVFQFSGPVINPGTVTASSGTATAAANGNEIVVTLANVADNQRVTVSLAGIDGTHSAVASLAFLVGDVTSSFRVTAADISAIKTRFGPVSNGNFVFDLDASGTIDALDLSALRSRSGQLLP